MSVRWWFPRPQSRPLTVYPGQEEDLRHATWLELFLDLVFVLAVAALGGYLHSNLTPGGLLRFAGLFAIGWWIWLTISYFADTYDTNDLTSHVMVIAAMFGVIFLSRTVEGVFAGGSFAFAVGVLVLRLFLTASHLRARHLRSEANAFMTSWLGLEVVVTVVWTLSLLVAEPLRFGFWAASLAIGVVGMMTIYLRLETIIAPEASHCNERFGLFTIIVLGETILAVGIGTSGLALAAPSLVVGGFGFLIAVAIWWLYFSGYQERTYDRTLLAQNEHWKDMRKRGLAHVYGHYFVHVGIVAAGVAIAVAIEAASTDHALDFGARLALVAGLGAFLLGSGVSTAVGQTPIDRRLLAGRASAVVLLGLIALAAATSSPIALTALASLVLVCLVVVEGLHPWMEPSAVSAET